MNVGVNATQMYGHTHTVYVQHEKNTDASDGWADGVTNAGQAEFWSHHVSALRISIRALNNDTLVKIVSSCKPQCISAPALNSNHLHKARKIFSLHYHVHSFL